VGRHDDVMRKKLADHVRQLIGPFAVPDTIHWVSELHISSG
jgi:acetyl-CoA synthetase